MDKFMKIFEAFLQKIFGKLPDEPKELKVPTYRKITRIPSKGDQGDHVKIYQEALNDHSAVSPNLKVDGDYGDQTDRATKQVQSNIGSGGTGVVGPKTLKALFLVVDETQATTPKDVAIPWYVEAQTHKGKKETNATWAAKLGALWGKVGLPQYKGKLSGSTYAWCALFIFGSLTWAGYDTAKLNASARSADNYGQAVNWVYDGIPRGAVVRLNGSGNCTSWTGNHVTMSNGACAPQDVIEMTKGSDGQWRPSGVPPKKKGNFSGFGGNQADQVKISNYPVKNICSVRWPSKKTDGTPVALPPAVKVSENCSNGATADVESTR